MVWRWRRKYKLISHPWNSSPFAGAFLNFVGTIQVSACAPLHAALPVPFCLHMLSKLNLVDLILRPENLSHEDMRIFMYSDLQLKDDFALCCIECACQHGL